MMDSCFFAGSPNISDKGAVVSRQFCGPLGNTFPRWSRAGGRACRQRFALSILLACSHHPPNLSGVPEGMLRPFLDVLTHPLPPGMQSTCTSAKKNHNTSTFQTKRLFCWILYFKSLFCTTCDFSIKVDGNILRIVRFTQHKQNFFLGSFFGTSPFLLGLKSALSIFQQGS